MYNISRLLLVSLIAFGVTFGAAFNAMGQPIHEKILVPVFFSGPGAHGSQWWTTVSIVNAGENTIRFNRPVLAGDPSCSDLCGCETTDEIQSNEVGEICIANAHPSGLILYMHKNQPEPHFGARISDLSRSVDTAGTELKIVRESELRKGRIILPNIPIGPGYRVGLRLFDTAPPPAQEILLIIRDYGALNSIPLVEATIQLNPSPDAGAPFPAHPAFAMIGDLAAQYPQLNGHESILIELWLPELDISPVPAPSYWALASITNNVTQQVTMVSPQ
jgi:hypothetical protein